MPNVFERALDSISSTADDVDHYFDRTDADVHVWEDIPSKHGISGKVDRNKGAKSFGKKAMKVAQSGVSVTQHTMGYQGASGLAITAAMGGAGAALSATGIGLLAAGSAFSLMKSGLAFKSARSTLYHIGGLERIYAGRNQAPCSACNGVAKNSEDHRFIASVVLPAIIAKKKRKFARKATTVVPLAGGLLVGVESGGRSLMKRLKGNRGQKRHFHAQVLAKHLVTHDCELAKLIVAELFSGEELYEIMKMSTGKAGPLICSKMRSV